MDDADADQESYRLALKLQMEDLEALGEGQKGKQRVGQPSDFEMALALQRLDLADSAALDQDRRMCHSIARAINGDSSYIQAYMEEAEQASHGRYMAYGGSGGKGKAMDLGQDYEFLEPVDESFVRKLEYYNRSRRPEHGESSSAAARRAKTEECVSCMNEYATSSLAKCPCSHKYCRRCMSTLFEKALVDESMFPPRCCNMPIPVDDLRDILSRDLVGKFRAKEVELNTPNRTYCHRPQCSAFIPQKYVRHEIATCARCRAQTCVRCKGPRHARECPKDRATQEVLRMAEDSGWKRCYSCKRVVELKNGCNHITCVCRAEFCYICGRKWKTCDCALWSEENLLERRAAMADRDVDGGPLQRQGRDVIVQPGAYRFQHHGCLLVRDDLCAECNDALFYHTACDRCRYNHF